MTPRRGDHVRIAAGRLYSPQAPFVMSRRNETFGRDAIVPQSLAAPSGTTFLPWAWHAGVATGSGFTLPLVFSPPQGSPSS